MFQKGDLIKFIKPPNRASMNPSLEDYVGTWTIAVVLNSEMKRVYPNDPLSHEYEKITIYSLATEQIVTAPANNWQLIEEANK